MYSTLLHPTKFRAYPEHLSVHVTAKYPGGEVAVIFDDVSQAAELAAALLGMCDAVRRNDVDAAFESEVREQAEEYRDDIQALTEDDEALVLDGSQVDGRFAGVA